MGLMAAHGAGTRRTYTETMRTVGLGAGRAQSGSAALCHAGGMSCGGSVVCTATSKVYAGGMRLRWQCNVCTVSGASTRLRSIRNHKN